MMSTVVASDMIMLIANKLSLNLNEKRNRILFKYIHVAKLMTSLNLLLDVRQTKFFGLLCVISEI